MKNSPVILLSGGNGYIGGTTAFALREAGFTPVILDNFSTSQKGKLQGFELLEVDLTVFKKTQAALKSLGPISGIIHFAARALVPESCRIPEEYFRNNLLSTYHLAEVALQLDIPVFVHSSSCAVYGVPSKVPIREDSPLTANSPYGETKILAEKILNRYLGKNRLKVLNLRYFNPAGAWLKYGWGECHEPETHLIPNLVRAAMENQTISVFGTDYPTPDGSCIRDFIHVTDLAEAHVVALKALLSQSSLPAALNVGTGQGSSVFTVLKTAEEVFGRKLQVKLEAPRPGDPPALIADANQLQKLLNWRPSKSLREMIEDDWRWRSSVVK